MNKKTIGYLFLLILFSMVVIAATTLRKEKQVTVCNDSDRGLKFNTRGFISGKALNGNNYTFTDTCKDALTLVEGACRFDGNKTYAQLWSYDCNSNETCSSGACILTTTTTTTSTTITTSTTTTTLLPTCFDSDGGQNVFIAGNVTYVDQNGTIKISYDYCTTSGDFDIVENFCDLGQAKLTVLNCPIGYSCIAGACIQS